MNKLLHCNRWLLASTLAYLIFTDLGPRRLLAYEPSVAAQSQPFDFSTLKDMARSLSKTAYVPPPAHLPAPIANLTWDQMQAIRFKHDHALWANDGVAFRLRFFHLGLYNRVPVKMYEVVDGKARPIAYDPSLFDYGQSGVDGRKLPTDLGFAGFQVAKGPNWSQDIAAFQGASYFRAVGVQGQYGLSARGLAIDCGLPRAEEFPIFTAFWFDRPKKDEKTLTLFALLDSPSVTGAYRFGIIPADTLLLDVECVLYPRKSIERLGVAPLTSMFQCGENDRRMANDFRPEIHDSDGLSFV
ncbi:MAG TPA: glucan biosynthesis protein, partial [Pirellulales bacterium]|nr:glucan biosynthesis protein [Pirellulales bacterium]